MREEAIDVSITAVEKFPNDYDKACEAIKEAMDKRFGTFWHAVVGEGFGAEISYELKNIVYLFVGGRKAVLLWKF